MNWPEIIKWVLIVNGAFLLIYLILTIVVGRDKDRVDWEDDDKKRHRWRR